MTARITLISHAATAAQRRAAFPLDEPVEERELAKLASSQWKLAGAQEIVCGPELRTRETARALALSMTVENRLRDCDYGVWNGRTLDEIQSQDPAGLLAWLSNPEASPHGGESIARLLDRVSHWLAERTDAGHTIAITHPAVIRCAVLHALQAPVQAFWRIDIVPATVTDIRFNGAAWAIRRLSSPLLKQDALQAGV